MEKNTLQGINISHLGKRKIIFKMPFWGDMLVSWRVRSFDVGVQRIFENTRKTEFKANGKFQL